MNWKRFKAVVLYFGAVVMLMQAGRHLSDGATELDNIGPAIIALGIAYYLVRRARTCAG